MRMRGQHHLFIPEIPRYLFALNEIHSYVKNIFSRVVLLLKKVATYNNKIKIVKLDFINRFYSFWSNRSYSSQL